MRPEPPYLATAVWLVVLVKAVTPPVWSSPVGLFSRFAAPEVDVATPSSETPLVPTRTEPASETSDLTTDLLLGQVGDFPTNVGHTSGVPFESPPPTGTAATTDPATKPEPEDVPVVSPVASEDSARQRRAPRSSATAPLPYAPAASSTWRPVDWLGVVWLAGLLALVIRAIRGWCCIRAALRDVIEPDAALVAMFDETRRRLRVRTPVRLVVTRRATGPAVVGLLRPTIVLPVVVVRGRSPRDLEPILVHELLHVRRGDLWVGALQLLVAGVWWFHPLVWWVNRSLTRDVERCCDAESVAALGRPPAEYARSLVAVLELKRDLEAVPAFPGVRPLDVTANRLERIMRLPNKPNPWTRWGTRLVLLALAALVLPGAAGRAERKDEQSEADRPFPNEGAREIALAEEADDEPSRAATGGDVGNRVEIDVPALGPVPLAFDFAIPALGADVDERIFSFYLGFEDRRTGDFAPATGDGKAWAADPAPDEDPVPLGPVVVDDSPTREAESGEEPARAAKDGAAREPALVRQMGEIELRIRTPDGSKIETQNTISEDQKANFEAIKGTKQLDFEVVLRGKPVIAGQSKWMLLRRTLDGSSPDGRPASIEAAGVAFRLVGDFESLNARGAAERLRVDLNAKVGKERCVRVTVHDGVELQSPDARMTANNVELTLDPNTGDTSWRFDRMVMFENIAIAIRNGQQWQTLRAKFLDMDGKGQIRLGGVTPFVRETVENEEHVTRSNWPVPFVHREPLAAAEDAGPGVLPARPAEPSVLGRPARGEAEPSVLGRPAGGEAEPSVLGRPAEGDPAIGRPGPPAIPAADPAALATETAEPQPAAARDDLVIDLLLGTAPAAKPLTAEQMLERWQTSLPDDGGEIHVEFSRTRYDHGEKIVAISDGVCSFSRVEVKTGEFRNRSTYALSGHSDEVSPRQGYRAVQEPEISIDLLGTELRVSRPGPDTTETLTADQVLLVAVLRALQVGVLTDEARESFDWSAVQKSGPGPLYLTGKSNGGRFAGPVESVEVILDPETMRPTATKLVMENGAETVHSNLRYGSPEPPQGRPLFRPATGSRSRPTPVDSEPTDRDE